VTDEFQRLAELHREELERIERQRNEFWAYLLVVAIACFASGVAVGIGIAANYL
jgi:hypothetical protein